MVGMGIRRGKREEGKGKSVEDAETDVRRNVESSKMLGAKSEDRYDGREYHRLSSANIPAGWCDLGLEM
ncbi:uncharacterized protein EAF01_004637 [Botrytis porri]|uniref:uncharacterized protein n=1 Tax=Botrytis porri TaxID=87229 RepID=UPI0018FF1451|nr:uncharacterized protein EAF01_004637 [Botrytis porri]KAF7907050.1 hypothetical protein EAF01_004637 [Botrytis porri]